MCASLLTFTPFRARNGMHIKMTHDHKTTKATLGCFIKKKIIMNGKPEFPTNKEIKMMAWSLNPSGESLSIFWGKNFETRVCNITISQ